jgi:cathepsin L
MPHPFGLTNITLMFALIGFAASALVHAHEERSFLAHIREHGLAYTGEEYNFRLGLFLAHVRWIREFNAVERGFTVGLNEFSTLTPAEAALLCGSVPPPTSNLRVLDLSSVGAPPAELDWRSQGVVQAIKNQGNCGACWAFAAVSAQESAWAIKTGQLTSLSEQNLIDCVTNCKGCSGGNAEPAYAYVIMKQAGNFNSEAKYGYQAAAGSCRYSAADALTNIKDMAAVTRSEAALQSAVASYGPITVSIDASHQSFQAYRSGIYNETACSDIKTNHVVVVVGYGTSPSDYWLVRNSWGKSWGEQGYIRMTRNKDNQCGISTYTVLPFD